MVDPLGVVTAILTVAQLIRSAASTVKQNKVKCAQTLAHVLPSLACANDAVTARVLERLRGAVDEALSLVRSCQSSSMFSSSKKAGELDSVDKRINNCIMDLTLISQARANNNGAEAAAAKTGVHVDHSSSYYQAKGGGASTAHVGLAPPTPQHAWSTPQGYYQAQGSTAHVAWPPTPQHAWGTPQGYYQQQPPGGYGQWVLPGPAPYYPASPAPSGSNLSSFYTLPTVNKIFNSMFR